jgi:CRP-like cAMP-binding protein
MKISVVSKQGKEAVIGLLGTGDFVGEECVASGHPVRLTIAKALTDCELLRISRKEMTRAISQKHGPLSDVFVSFLLARNARFQEDLVDQLLTQVRGGSPECSCFSPSLGIRKNLCCPLFPSTVKRCSQRWSALLALALVTS